MPNEDENRVFDVSKPSKVGPSATSKPVIVGHQPSFADPMVREENKTSSPISIAINDGSEEPAKETATEDSVTASEIPNNGEEAMTHGQQIIEPTISEPDVPSTEEPAQKAKDNDSSSGLGFTPLNSLLGDDDKNKVEKPKEEPKPAAGAADGHVADTPPLHIPQGAGPRRRSSKILKWLLIILLVVIIAGYLAIDAGLVKSNINLPFHIFNKQKKNTPFQQASTPAPAPAPKPSGPVVPAGFTVYKLAGTGVSFAYPNSWGQPTITTDPGFSKRGGANKSDGTYAYLVNFAVNKDVQIVLTSSKYLSQARTTQYYDFLQWCIGTNDNKFYKESLHFTTVDKVDTPSTVTCDQGPLSDATKLDNQTIVQLKTTAPDGKTVIGDLYTQNLDKGDLVVLRIKDAAMTHGADIKQLLQTVQVSVAPAASSNSTSTTTP